MLNKNIIQQLIHEYNIHPSKSKGQNFLIDEESLAEIVKAADLTDKDYVLEIGPGLGVLTEQLVKSAHQVLAVELDKNLLFYVKKKFKNQANLEILEGDILKIKNLEINQKLAGQKYKVVANLPYNITKPILRKFLTYDPKPESLVILVQKEVAEKIAATKNKHGILSLSIWFYAQPEIIDYVSSASFYPQPKVDSAILKIKIRKGYPAEMKKILNQQELADFSENKFWQLVKIGFSAPRKKLQNNLSSGLRLPGLEIKNIMEKIGLDFNIRAEDLSLNQWIYIYQQLIGKY